MTGKANMVHLFKMRGEIHYMRAYSVEKDHVMFIHSGGSKFAISNENIVGSAETLDELKIKHAEYFV